MKNWGWGFIVTLGVFFCAATVSAVVPPTAAVNIIKSYVPGGFDNNDHVQIMVTGEFASTCYKVAPYTFEVHGDVIDIQQNAYVYGGFCLFLVVPYSQVIDLGVLDEGTYKLRDMSTGNFVGSLPVKKSTSASADDFLYAGTTDARIQTENGKSILHLSGNFTDTCTKIDEVKVTIENDVIVAQPIVKRDATSKACTPKKTPFEFTEPIRDGLRGTYLLHVRTLDGQSINRLAMFPDVCPL